METSAFLPEAELHVPVRGGTLQVFRYGPGGGNPILALHGTTSTNRAWQCFARTMNEHGYTIYAPDLRGRGRSNKLPPPFGLKTQTEDLLAVIDYVGPHSWEVVGHSSGAFLAAAFTQVAPERVSRLVLIDGGIPLPLPPGYSVEQLNTIVLGPALARLAMEFTSFEEYKKFFVDQPAFKKGWTPVLDEYIRHDLDGQAPHLHPSTNPDAVAQDSLDLFDGGYVEKILGDVDRDILLLRAPRGLQDGDPLYNEAMLIEVLKKFPKVRYVNVDDVNHYDILIEQSGADKCIKIIYGIGR